MSSLRNDVRRRLRMRSLRSSLGERYEGRRETYKAGVIGKNLISIGGQAYDAAVDLPVGSNLDVINVGRPGQALYVSSVGQGSVVSSGGNSSSSPSAPSDLDLEGVLALIDSTRGLSVVSGYIGINLATTPGLEFDSGGALLVKDYYGVELTSNGLGVKKKTTSGLALDTNGLAVGAGDGIDVLTSTIAVDVTDFIDGNYGLYEPTSNNIGIKRATDSGLAFHVSGGLQLGTPGSVSATSANGLSGVTHTHDADSSSDVGTTPPGVNKLLHATSLGGLILATLAVKGDLSVTDGGDLTVGSNLLFADVSQDSVGILREPDPQFALDVNGPIRGTELVGKHAIQLDDLAILLHYDGGHPYETNYTGEPNAVPLGTVPTAVGGEIHYRPGKFYKAAVFGRNRTNLVANGSFETTTSGWYIYNDSGGDLGMSRTTDDSWYGSYSVELTWTTINNSQFYNGVVGSASGGAYTASVWMRALVPCSVDIRLQRDSSPYTVFATETASVTEEWQVFQVTGTPSMGDDVRLNIRPQGSGNTVYVDGVQVVTGSIAGWYIDGSLGDGHSWSGTEFNSTSTRTQGRLQYALENMKSHRWTVMSYVRFSNINCTNNYAVYEMVISGGYKIRVYQGSTNLTCAVTHSGGTSYPSFGFGTFDPNVWYHVAVTYDNTYVRLYLDGEPIGAWAYDFDGGAPTTLYAGYGSSQYGDVMLDDLCVSRQCLTANRIKAIYESDAPVFATSSVFSFRATPKGLVWADEEGLWMRDADGDTVLGAYGGEAATKSWGGFTLEQGDIAFGRYGASDGGWFLFDRDGVSSKPYLSLGYADNDVISFGADGATIDGDIDVLGTVYAGDQNVILDADGITLIAPDYASGTWDIFSDELENVIWKRSGTPIASIGAQYSSSLLTDGLILTARAHSGSVASAVVLEAQEDDGTIKSSIWVRDSGEILLTSNLFTFNTGYIDAQRAEFEQASSIGANPVLKLTQSDVSEEFINFAAATGGSNPITGAALGSYVGKVRVSINGTKYWMPYYN